RELVLPVPPGCQAGALPPQCIKCGARANGKPVVKTFYWHHPALYLVILAGVLIYAIVAIVVRKSIKVAVPLCAEHAKRRSIAVTLAWVLPLIGFADIFVLSQLNVNGGIIALLTVGLLLAGMVIWAVVAIPMRPTMIAATRGEFTGVCATFLEQFPEAERVGPATPQAMVPPPPIG